jgi:hypothetical protein
MKDTEEEFFSTYAQNYADPEAVWLEGVIQRAGAVAGPNSIARVVLDAGYVRSKSKPAPSDDGAVPFAHPLLTHANGDQCIWDGDSWFVPTSPGGDGYDCPHDHPFTSQPAKES